MQKYMKNPHTVPFNRIDVGIDIHFIKNASLAL